MLRVSALVVGLLVLACIGWVSAALVQSLPAPKLAVALHRETTVPGKPLALTVPSGVQAAVAVEGVGLMATRGAERATPIASLTKMMSALVVLHDHPLAAGASGPEITITPGDVATYLKERHQGDSVVPVRAGEQLSELQALEGALIPSGDNIVQLLAVWDAGSIGAFTTKMNAFARSLGLGHTHYAGPSGVNPATVSTATDQLQVAETAMRDRVFAKIVSMPQVVLPVAGVQYNVDSDLGSDGIDGIKTGWIPQGGASFVFSAVEKLAGRQVRVIGDVIGEQGSSPLPTALAAARQIVLAAKSTLRIFRFPAGTRVGTVSAPYGRPVPVLSTTPVTFVAWSGAQVRITLDNSARLPNSLRAGSSVGRLTLGLGAVRATTGLRAVSGLQAPSFSWRLEHP